MIPVLIILIGLVTTRVLKLALLPWITFTVAIAVIFSISRTVAIENNVSFIPQYIEFIIGQIVAITFAYYGKKLDDSQK